LASCFAEIGHAPEILKAVNPYYAINLLTNVKGGFLAFGAVFLCTTGAERYTVTSAIAEGKTFASHGDREGDVAAQLLRAGSMASQQSRDNAERLQSFLWTGAGMVSYSEHAIATGAAIVASQALISGSFTLINEAIRLNFWPKVRIVYPLPSGGSYIYLLLTGCYGQVALALLFTSRNQAAWKRPTVLLSSSPC